MFAAKSERGDIFALQRKPDGGFIVNAAHLSGAGITQEWTRAELLEIQKHITKAMRQRG